MIDLSVHGGLAAKLVEKLCEDKQVLRVCSEDIDIVYGEDSLGNESLGEKIFDGTHLGLYMVENSHSLECHIVKKDAYASGFSCLETALLVIFSISGDFWEVFDGEPAGEVAAKAKLTFLKERIEDVFPMVLEEYKNTVNNVEETDYVQYKILSVGGALKFASPSVIYETGKFLLSYYEDIEKEGCCVAKSGWEIAAIMEHLTFSCFLYGRNLEGSVIVWKRNGEESISARYISKAEIAFESFGNQGARELTYEMHEVGVFDYTYESVANEAYFLDFEEQIVKPVSDVVNTDTYLGIGFDYNESWMIHADGTHCVTVFDCRAFRTYGAAYDAMNESVAELKVREFYFNKYIGKTSDFGLENIVRHRVRMAAERL